jgi:uncharacterized phage-associated protein
MDVISEPDAGAPYDVRAIANLLLQYGRDEGLPLSNLSLQKVLYFAHGLFLSRYDRPLVDGYFEAWENGPVHPLIYHAFKHFGSSPIQGFAERLDLRTRKRTTVAPPVDERVRHFIRTIARTYGRMPAPQLVGWSHRKDAPWHAVVGSGPDRRGRFGLRIENELIRERFHHHKFTIADQILDGEVREELPPACD